jgi:hypothetical protein
LRAFPIFIKHDNCDVALVVIDFRDIRQEEVMRELSFACAHLDTASDHFAENLLIPLLLHFTAEVCDGDDDPDDPHNPQDVYDPVTVPTTGVVCASSGELHGDVL